MSLFEENETIIQEIQETIKHLKIAQIENDIKTMNPSQNNYREIILTGFERALWIQNRICAVNESLIYKHEALRNRLAMINNLICSPCGIQYIDMPLNQNKFLVQTFYQSLYDKYRTQPVRLTTTGLISATNARSLKVDTLDADDQAKAKLLNDYLTLCSIEEQLEAWINFVKAVQFNYLPTL